MVDSFMMGVGPGSPPPDGQVPNVAGFVDGGEPPEPEVMLPPPPDTAPLPDPVLLPDPVPLTPPEPVAAPEPEPPALPVPVEPLPPEPRPGLPASLTIPVQAPADAAARTAAKIVAMARA
jgi:hypothetical protein